MADAMEPETLPSLSQTNKQRRGIAEIITVASLIIITISVIVSAVAVTASFDFSASLGKYINPNDLNRVPTPTVRAPGVNERVDWTTFLQNDGGWNYNDPERIISPTSAKQLALVQSFTIGEAKPITDAIVSTPLLVGNTLYFGSWNGYYYAVNADTHQVLWQHFTAVITPPAGCQPPFAGISSKATYVNGVLYLGGPDGFVYALDAATGNAVWRTKIATPPNEFLWGSPAVGNGHVYMPVGSYGDCPLIPGRLVMLDQKTGTNLMTHYTDQPTSGNITIWNKPVLDAPDNEIFYATGSYSSGAESGAVVELDWNTLAVKNIWPIPLSDRGFDNAFGASCNLLPSVGAPGQRGLICHTKATRVYGLMMKPTGLTLAWTVTLGKTDGASPEFGNADVGECGFDTKLLYCGGTQTIVDGVQHAGGIYAIDPISGAVKWRTLVDDGYPLTAITIANGVLAIALANVYNHGVFLALAATDGSVLYRFPLTVTNYSAPIIVNGRIYVPTADGHIFVFGVYDSVPSSDLFTGHSLGNQWQWLKYYSKHTRLTGNTLQIDAAGLYLMHNENYLYERPPQGDFTITTQLHFVPTSQYEQAGIDIYQDTNDYIKLGIMNTAPGKLTFEFVDLEAGNGSESYIDDPYPIDAHILLQMVRINGVYYAYVSDDGSLWTELNTLAANIVPTGIGIGASTSHLNQFQTVDFYSCVMMAL